MSPDRCLRTALLAACLALPLCAAQAQAADYVQEPGSTLVFASTYEGEAFTGRFPGFVTRFSFDPAHLETARLDVTIPLATASTGNSDYDGEIRGSGFFDTARFPQARYSATKFRALGGDRYAADGTLMLRGVSKPVTLAFTWTPGPKPVLSGKATVNRLTFGVGAGEWSDTSLLPDEVAVSPASSSRRRNDAPAPRPQGRGAASQACNVATSKGQPSSRAPCSSRNTGTRSP